jgi:hypothetical protein
MSVEAPGERLMHLYGSSSLSNTNCEDCDYVISQSPCYFFKLLFSTSFGLSYYLTVSDHVSHQHQTRRFIVYMLCSII